MCARHLFVLVISHAQLIDPLPQDWRSRLFSEEEESGCSDLEGQHFCHLVHVGFPEVICEDFS